MRFRVYGKFCQPWEIISGCNPTTMSWVQLCVMKYWWHQPLICSKSEGHMSSKWLPPEGKYRARDLLISSGCQSRLLSVFLMPLSACAGAQLAYRMAFCSFVKQKKPTKKTQECALKPDVRQQKCSFAKLYWCRVGWGSSLRLRSMSHLGCKCIHEQGKRIY